MDLALLVPLADVGQDLGLGEGAGGVADEPVLLGQGEVDHGCASRRWPSRAAGTRSRRSGSRARRPSAPIRVPILVRVTRPTTTSTSRPSPHPTCPRSSAATSSASWSHGDRPPPVRHGGQRVSRLRQRHRRHGARPHPPAGHGGDPRPGRQADRPDRTRSASRRHGHRLATMLAATVPGPARRRPVPQLGLRGDRRRAQARPTGHRPPRDHRVPRRLPRPDDRRDERDDLEPQLPDGLRAAAAGRVLRAVPRRLPRVRRRRGGRDAIEPRHPARRCSRRSSRRRRSPPILIEPVQGEGGYYPAPAAFLRELRALCDEHGILLIADEVQSGFGRTGEMWAFEHAGIVPDVVVTREGDRERPAALGDRRQPRTSRSAGVAAPTASTYGGNPVACAAGVAVLETIADEDLVANARAARRGAVGRPARARWPSTPASATCAGRA